MGGVLFSSHGFLVGKYLARGDYVVVQLVDAMLRTSESHSNQIIAIKLLENVTVEALDDDEDTIETLDKINAILFDSSEVIAQAYSAVLHNK